MSMYLPKDDVGPTGEEAAEFLAEPEPHDDGTVDNGTDDGANEDSTRDDDA